MSLFDFFSRKAPVAAPKAPPPIADDEEKSRRIAALLSGRGAFLAMELCGVDAVPVEYMRQVFPFTRQAILDHLAAHQLPIESFIAPHGMDLASEGDRMVLTEYDDRIGPTKRYFPDLVSARDYLLEFCLSHTYTGLDFRA